MGGCCEKTDFKVIDFLENCQDGDFEELRLTYSEYEFQLELLNYRDADGRTCLHLVSQLHLIFRPLNLVIKISWDS